MPVRAYVLYIKCRIYCNDFIELIYSARISIEKYEIVCFVCNYIMMVIFGKIYHSRYYVNV